MSYKCPNCGCFVEVNFNNIDEKLAYERGLATCKNCMLSFNRPLDLDEPLDKQIELARAAETLALELVKQQEIEDARRMRKNHLEWENSSARRGQIIEYYRNHVSYDFPPDLDEIPTRELADKLEQYHKEKRGIF